MRFAMQYTNDISQRLCLTLEARLSVGSRAQRESLSKQQCWARSEYKGKEKKRIKAAH